MMAFPSMLTDAAEKAGMKVIAAVPDDKIMTSTLEDFLALGLRWQQ